MSRLNNEDDFNPTLVGKLDVTFNNNHCKQQLKCPFVMCVCVYSCHVQ